MFCKVVCSSFYSKFRSFYGCHQLHSSTCQFSENHGKVCNDHDPVIITRKRESPVVMLSLEDYQSMEETAYLLRSPANARHLLESIAELEAGKGTERELIE